MALHTKHSNEGGTFADVLYAPRFRKAQSTFLNRVDMMIDWRPIRTLINKKYTKRVSAVGAPAYDCILLFKMLLLETWYHLSDCELENRINDSITFSRFLGLRMEDVSPDHSTVSRFRTALTDLGLMDKLLEAINKQPERHHISVKEGLIIDASIVDTPRKPNGSVTIEVAGDREDNRSDIKELIPLLSGEEIPEGTPVPADKGYASKANRSYLESRKLKDGIMHKAQRNKPLTDREKAENKAISPVRSTIERTFGSIRRWFKGGRCRYVGLAKAHTQNIIESIAFNLYRTPGIIMSSCAE